MIGPFVIIRDTREQQGFSFNHEFLGIIETPTVKSGTLKTGDYSLEGFESKLTIERKSLVDLFGSCGKNGRDRFEREFIRMAEFEYAALVIEADWTTIYKSPPQRSKLNPKNILRTLTAWHMRYNVHLWPCPSRKFAEKTTYLLLDRFYRDQLRGAANVAQSIESINN